MSDNLDKIKGKLQKLMKLYEGAKKIKSEGEANAAAAAIQRLLAEYNLSMGDIERDEEDDAIKEEIMSCYRIKFIGGQWEFALMNVLCKYNFCKAAHYGAHKNKQMMFFGKKENMETVKWMYFMLCDRFVALGKNRFYRHQETEEYVCEPIGLDTYLRRYLMGCVRGLEDKFEEEKRSTDKNDKDFSDKVTALTIRNEEAIQEYIRQKYNMSKSKERRTKLDSSFFSGYEDGRRTEINKQLEENKKAQINKVKFLD